MPFIEKAELAKLSGAGGEIKRISQLTDDAFASLEAAAAQIIKSETGVAIPELVADAPPWSKLPATWLMFSIYITDQPTPTQELLQSSKQAWDRAMRILSKHSPEDTSGIGISKTDLIEGMYDA